MLDLIILGSAAAITKRICHDAEKEKQQLDPIQKTSQYLFQTCLFLSLLLFSLAILEAAPLSWMVLIYRSSILIYWYRILLCAICVLILLVHPICLAFAMSSKSKSLSSSSTIQSKSWNRVGIIVQLIWAVVRFFTVAIIWRFFLQKIVKMILPSNYFEYDENDDCGNNHNSIGEESTSQKRKWRHYCTFMTVGLSSVLICLSLVCLEAIRTVVIRNSDTNYDNIVISESTQQQQPSLMKTMVTMICSFGLIVASILNGFGSSSLPHSNLVGIFLKPTPTSTISKAEKDCYYAKSQLEEKECLLEDATQSIANGRSSAFATSQSPSNMEKKKIQQLQDEVMFLTSLVKDMNEDILEMKQSQQIAKRARTKIGRIRAILGVIFSIVLIVRVMLASKSLSLLFQDEQTTLQSPRDPITSILLWLIGNNFVSEDQYNDLAQGTSLVLAGVLSISQVNSFLRVINALGRRLNKLFGESCGKLHQGKSRHHPVSSSVGNILASHIMGSYFLACVVVVKMNLPEAYRASFSAAVGFNFDFNRDLLNVVFFAASLTSASILGLLIGIQRNNSTRYQFDSHLSLNAVQTQMA